MALDSATTLAIKITAQDTTKAAFASLHKSLNDLSGLAIRAGAAIGGALAINDVIQRTRNWGRELQDLVNVLGISGEAASRWNYQGRIVGITADEITQAFGQLTKKVFDDMPAIEAGTSVFDKWGVAVRNSNREILDAESIVENVRQKIQELGPGLAARALEMDLFGRSGGRLHDFLALSNDEMRQMKKDMEALGVVTTTSGVAAMTKMEHEMNRLGIILDIMKVQIGSALIPMFVTLASAITRPSGPLKGFIDAVRYGLGIVKSVVEAVLRFTDAIGKKGLIDALLALGGTLKDIVLKTLSDIGEKLDSLGPLGTLAKDALIAIGGAAVLGAIQNVITKLGLLLKPVNVAIFVAIVGVDEAIKQVQKTLTLIQSNPVAMKIAWESGEIQKLMTEFGLGIALGLAGAVLVGFAGFPILLATAFGVAVATLTVAIVNILQNEGERTKIRNAIGEMFDAMGSTVYGAIKGWPWLKAIADSIDKLDLMLNPKRSTGPGGTPENPFVGRPTTSVDVFDAFVKLLGREAGAEEIYGRIGMPVDQMIAEIQSSPEFAMIQRARAEQGGFAHPVAAQSAVLKRISGITGAGIAAPGLASYFASQGIALANGGIVTRPTYALVGERGPEAVVPLGRGGGWGAPTINITGNNIDSRERVRELARAVASEVMRVSRSSGNWSY